MADGATHETTDAKIYVNKQNDIFYFEGQADYYWFLHTILFADEAYDTMIAYGEARCRFLEQIFGIKTYGFHWDLLQDMMANSHHSWIVSLQAEQVVAVMHEGEDVRGTG